MADKPEVIVTVLYRKKEGLILDMDYYLGHHIPLTNSIWGKEGMTSCAVCDVGEDSEFALKVILMWKNMDSWEGAQAAEATKQISADYKNFTNGEFIVIVGKIIN